ncbi:MAG: chitobiase/beta-hexosaminidase C-terminal domain-containing protein, partial [Spirochaetes bacterium]|nr:chitobiase/beta-hexosaminidase C-terminal domain-containing protein [Spirochaetota bacterium]
MRIWTAILAIGGAILIAVCADSKGKRTYIEGVENDIFSQSVTRALQPGNLIYLLDQNGAVRPIALKDFTGAGQVTGLDLNNDGVVDIRISPIALTRMTSRSFTAPADIDNDGIPEYYVYFVVSGNSVRISFLTANSAQARELVFIVDANSQITGLDTNGDGSSDDARLNGVTVVAPTMVNTPVYSPAAGAFTAAQNVTISTTTAGAILCYTTDGVTTPACNAAKTSCATGTLYSTQVNVTANQTLRTIGCLDGKNDSLAAVGSFVIDGTAPTITAAPLSGLFVSPQAVMLTGSVTTGQGALDGSLAVSQICYTWGADASGNPLPATIPGNPSFPCTATNNQVLVQSNTTQLNVGCATRAKVTDGSDPNSCSFTAGIYHLKYIAMDAAGNITSVQSQSYAIGATPTITTVAAPKPHLWAVLNSWGQSGDTPTAAGATTRASTTWTWSADMDGTYTIRLNDASGNCTGGTVSTGAFASGSTTAGNNISSVIQASDLIVDVNDAKVCFTPAGGSAISATQTIWRIAPADISATYAKVNFNISESVTLSLSDIFSPVNAIKTITFICPAGSTGVDANNACAQPTPSGSFLRAQGSGSVAVHSDYNVNVLPANRVTTIAYDVRITLCDNAGCAGTAGPTFGTEAAGPYSATGTLKFFILKDKTPGNSIFVAASGSDANPGTSRTAPKRSLSSAAGVATGGKAIYVSAGSYCGNGIPTCTSTTGTLSVPSGTSIFGGFTTAWYRPDVALNQANITAGSNSNADSIGISLGAVNSPIEIEGLNLTTQRVTPDVSQGYHTIGLKAASGTAALTLYKNSINAEGANTTAGGQSAGGAYGLHIANVNTVTLTSNTITAGGGWYGENGGLGGANGSVGMDGTAGTMGIAGCVACSTDSHAHATAGSGGTGGLGAANRGGNGGAGGWQDDGT